MARNVDLNGLIGQLIKQGVAPDVAAATAAKVLQSAGGSGVGQALRNEVIATGLLAAGQGVLDMVTGGQNAPPTVPMGGKGYVYTPQDQFQYERYYYSPGARLARATGAVMLDPETRRQQQIASSDQQLESANRRAIEKDLANRQAEAVVRGMELETALRERSLVEAGRLGVQELASLGDVQKQRVQSGYEAASNMLQKAIENIAYVEKMGSDSVAQQLGTLSNI